MSIDVTSSNFLVKEAVVFWGDDLYSHRDLATVKDAGGNTLFTMETNANDDTMVIKDSDGVVLYNFDADCGKTNPQMNFQDSANATVSVTYRNDENPRTSGSQIVDIKVTDKKTGAQVSINGKINPYAGQGTFTLLETQGQGGSGAALSI